MGLWTEHIKDYFYKFGKGTSEEILNWVLSNRKEEILKYYESQFNSLARKQEFLSKIWTKETWANSCFRNVTNCYNPISGILNTWFKKGKVLRIETNKSICKWEYYLEGK